MWIVDLLDLINALGLLVALEPRQAQLLDAVSSGPLITADDLRGEGILPVPAYAAKEPRPPRQNRRRPGPGQEGLDFPAGAGPGMGTERPDRHPPETSPAAGLMDAQGW